MSQSSKDIRIWQDLSQQEQTQITALLARWAVKYLVSRNQGVEDKHGVHK